MARWGDYRCGRSPDRDTLPTAGLRGQAVINSVARSGDRPQQHFYWLGRETGHNKTFYWLGRESGHNKGYLAADLIHGALGTDELLRINAVAGLFGGDAVADELNQFRVAAAAAHQGSGIPLHG